jgi:hypothetical protein
MFSGYDESNEINKDNDEKTAQDISDFLKSCGLSPRSSNELAFIIIELVNAEEKHPINNLTPDMILSYRTERNEKIEIY